MALFIDKVMVQDRRNGQVVNLIDNRSALLARRMAVYYLRTGNFNCILSLKTRVGISAGVMTLGYHKYWTFVFNELDL